FFETAQLIATHSHLRWPDLSREWIRRQQARIARDGDANSEPPAQSSPKKKTNKANKAKAKDRSVPLEVAPSSANVTEVAAKKKKKKGSKKRSREEASVEARETSAAVRDDDAERDDPAGSTRGSPEERPKKKSKKKAAEDDGTSAPEIPSRSGETATEVGDGSRGESPSSKGAPSDPEETGDAIQTDTGDVAAEDPVLVSSSEEREGDEVGEEETRSSPALVEEMDPILPVSDPPAPVEGLGDQVVERETTEALDPRRDDQDVVV
ncbi:hypothetical protein HID58_002053, partial [Brassica napus]